jgi:predicted acyl esterase
MVEEGTINPFNLDRRPRGGRSYKGHGKTQSVFIRMQDGVELAAEIILPRGLEPGKKIPTILTQTCYWRYTQLKAPLG